jgi:hypothetical protein
MCDVSAIFKASSSQTSEETDCGFPTYDTPCPIMGGSCLKKHTSVFCKFHYRGADKSLARPTSRCILFDSENISFDASLVIYINSTNIPPIMIINRIYEHQNLLSL